VPLTEAQMPNHNHPILALQGTATTGTPSETTALAVADSDLYGPPTDLEPMGDQEQGGGQAHNNMQPYLAMNFIIALVGLYPSWG
jgi:microcystin-dependent protein